MKNYDKKVVIQYDHNKKVVMMIPAFDNSGNLPQGVYWATWQEFKDRFDFSSHRKKLLNGLEAAIDSLSQAGCRTIYIDGSFVTQKENPNDFDGCWDITDVNPELLDPILLRFDNKREAQKAKYFGELFPASNMADGIKTFLEFFQIDRNKNPKGIVAIDLTRWKP